MRTVTVVGASLAGLNAVEQLRTQGFEGRIVVIGEESHRPYDRPPLTKKFLAGSVAADELRLADEADLTELAADWRLGVRAEHLDTAAGVVTLSDGTEIATDGVVIATGGRARSIPGWDDLVGVHTLRTIEDAIALRTELVEHAQSIVVVGAGWIGAEVASTCRELGLQVTVVEATQAPLAAALGQIGRAYV